MPIKANHEFNERLYRRLAGNRRGNRGAIPSQRDPGEILRDGATVPHLVFEVPSLGLQSGQPWFGAFGDRKV